MTHPPHQPRPHRASDSGQARRRSSRGGDAATPILRALAPAVYWPTAVFSVGTGAVAPVLVLAATDAGMSHAAAAGVLGLMGAVGVFSAPLAGGLVSRLGGRRSMILGTALMVASVITIVTVMTVGGAAAPALFTACIIAQAVSSNLWALARQGYVADAVPSWARARALSFLGGMMRLGVLIGPAVGSAVIIAGGRRGPFVLELATSLVALALVLRCALPDPHQSWGNAEFPTPEPGSARSPHPGPGLAQEAARGSRAGNPVEDIAAKAAAPRREKVDVVATAIVAFSMTALQLLRTNRTVIVPLWGTHLGMSDELISATFAAGALLDVAMFLPSGRWMDRYGRLAGIVPALTVMGASIVVTIVWTSPLGFVVGTCLMGLGNGFGSGIVMTMGADLAPSVGREKFLGWWQGIGNIGAAIGPFTVSALTATVGLTWGMWATALLGIGGGIWALLAMPRAYAHAGMDMRGRALPR